MSIFNWIGKLAEIPARLTAVTIEKIVCGAYEVYDDDLGKRQSELNARFKAITDQEQIAIDGGTATIAGGKEDIVSGSGAITTANAVAGYCADFMKGSSETVGLSGDITFSDTVALGAQKTIIYLNNTNVEHTVIVPNNPYRTPDGEVISIVVPAGGYGEVSILNIGGTVFARGC